MPEQTYRKSGTMRLVERLHPGRSIEEIVADTCREQPTPEAAAAALGVSKETLRAWRALFGQAEERQPAGVA